MYSSSLMPRRPHPTHLLIFLLRQALETLCIIWNLQASRGRFCQGEGFRCGREPCAHKCRKEENSVNSVGLVLPRLPRPVFHDVPPSKALDLMAPFSPLLTWLTPSGPLEGTALDRTEKCRIPVNPAMQGDLRPWLPWQGLNSLEPFEACIAMHRNAAIFA